MLCLLGPFECDGCIQISRPLSIASKRDVYGVEKMKVGGESEKRLSEWEPAYTQSCSADLRRLGPPVTCVWMWPFLSSPIHFKSFFLHLQSPDLRTEVPKQRTHTHANLNALRTKLDRPSHQTPTYRRHLLVLEGIRTPCDLRNLPAIT